MRCRTRWFTRTFFAVLGLAVGYGACAEQTPATTLSLYEAMELAQAESPELVAERYRQKATRAQVGQAWAMVLPNIQADASYSDQESDQIINSDLFDDTPGEKRSFESNPLSTSVTAEQTLFDGFQSINAIRAARAQRNAGAAQLAVVEQQILLETVTAFVGAVRFEKEIDALRTSIDAHIKQKNFAQARFDAGDGPITDVRQAEARLAGVRARLARAQSAFGKSRADLSALIGPVPQTLADSGVDVAMPESLDAALAFGRANAPTAHNARETAKASRRQAQSVTGEFAPRISAYATYRYEERPSPFTVQNEQFIYGVRASAPLFQGGGRIAKWRASKATAKRDAMQVAAVQRRLAARIQTYWRRIDEAQFALLAAQEQFEAASLALKGVAAEARQGLRALIDVLDAESERANAEIAIAQTNHDLLIAKMTLLAEMGALEPSVLNSAQ